MVPVFLIGGGGDHPERAAIYGPFLEAATDGARRRVVLVAAADSPAEAGETITGTRAIFTALGAAEADLPGFVLSPADRLTAEWLAATRATGVFVCGGPTPLYQQLLCEDRAWLDDLEAGSRPYGGVSAGAAIAARAAIVGGWQARRGDRVRPILYQGAGEGEDLLAVRAGLGLVPFTVEIHASQWGTLTRLLHALDLGLVPEGWAIDEDTLLQVDQDGCRVAGAGQVYHVTRTTRGTAEITIYTPPDTIPRPAPGA
jgi:cyanophycinase